jgi:hypothetical protein
MILLLYMKVNILILVFLIILLTNLFYKFNLIWIIIINNHDNNKYNNDGF